MNKPQIVFAEEEFNILPADFCTHGGLVLRAIAAACFDIIQFGLVHSSAVLWIAVIHKPVDAKQNPGATGQIKRHFPTVVSHNKGEGRRQQRETDILCTGINRGRTGTFMVREPVAIIFVLDGKDGASATPINARQARSIANEAVAVANKWCEANPIIKVKILHRIIAPP